MEKAISLEEGQIVLCTVDRIAGTVVFVKINDYNAEGAIVFSEIAPGRIRNIREYAVPGKKIVCKVLRIRPHGIDLSLRRVKLKEKNDFNEIYKKEKSYLALFKTILENGEEAAKKIKSDAGSLVDFLEKAKSNAAILEKYICKEAAEKILGALKEKKQKEKILVKKFSLSSKGSDGISIVKEIMKKAVGDSKCGNCEIFYVAAGKYTAKTRAINPKEADNQLEALIKNLEDMAKQKNCAFSLIK